MLHRYLLKFTNPKELLITTEAPKSTDNVVVVLDALTIYIPTTDLVDIKEVLANLNKEKEKLEAELLRSEKMLSNESFIAKAPQAKIDAEKEKQASYKKQYAEILEHIKKIS